MLSKVAVEVNSFELAKDKNIYLFSPVFYFLIAELSSSAKASLVYSLTFTYSVLRLSLELNRKVLTSYLLDTIGSVTTAPSSV